MSGFALRLAAATAFEDAIVKRLRDSGYLADRLGQGQLPSHQRDLLRLQQTPLRWMPDIVCQRQFGDCALCLLIDAKAGERFKDTGRHDIETSSLHALIEWKRFSKLPVFIVTADWRVHDPELVFATAHAGYFCGTGSGTPFVLWPATSGQSWESFFDPELLGLLAR